MADWRYEEHLRSPVGLAELPSEGHDGVAGGAACGDLVRIVVRVEGDRVAAAGFVAEGCGALTVCGSVACELLDGASIRDAARVSVDALAEGVGGLHPGKRHAAELVADALHRALGAAVAADAAVDPDVPARGTLVAMSGGVDSAVAALKAGPDAVAVTLELWRDPQNDAESSCCSHSAVRRARDLAHRMGMPHLTLDLRDAFRDGVVTPWIEDHRRGLTPNPCVRCNGNVRLDAMLDLADRIGCETLTTGHYARTTEDGLLRLAADPGKDQAYMLSGLRPSSVARMRFPLGALLKPQVRALAEEADLPVARTPDSQDLCFLAGTGRSEFLARHGGLVDRPGRILDAETGETLGEHQGAHLYTLGQRRGLGVGGGTPRYVVGTDVDTNVVTVGPKELLMTDQVRLTDVVLHVDAWRVDGVKLRYRQQPRRARVIASPGAGERGEGAVVLEEPLLQAAPGQTAMLLDGDVVVGSGTLA
ncbi:tRNA 2-thiouridine(34) synthase MnmA [Patulibacter sp.]|uniref:tRNA 2-thiouridine(34) synthase MnmA n=1 Tax=Patulibacter sp. TaxID=1912859 RepID=UPI00272003FA|nr:tRNA 2-thiouridine(34) synthase MnmA [Patulibacter sp.]MDO9407884.1 tRNA 2-thiouridine(34) synthase MnmA [Patulibacter sp.]